MYRIISGRSTGKTYQLMLLAKEKGAKIACSNPAAMREKALAYGITGIDFISYNELFNKETNNDDKILIDELETYIKDSMHSSVIGYSLTNED
jgi:hypothetical protein